VTIIAAVVYDGADPASPLQRRHILCVESDEPPAGSDPLKAARLAGDGSGIGIGSPPAPPSK